MSPHTPAAQISGEGHKPNAYLLAFVVALIGIASTGVVSLTGHVVTGGETTAGISKQIELVLDELKEMRKSQLEISTKQSELYTRREAREDGIASEQRLRSMEGRVGELSLKFSEMNSRMATLEAGYKTLEVGYRLIERFMSAPPPPPISRQR